MKKLSIVFICAFALAFGIIENSSAKSIVSVTGEGPNLRPRITQDQVVNGSLKEIQKHGVRIFSTPFNFHDGFGDGPAGRPTLQSNGTFLRVNGLDAQTCAECHSIKSNSTIPFTSGLGGTAGGGANVLADPTNIDPGNGDFNGRFINSPILFGVGGLELLAKEMTLELQELKQEAIVSPGSSVNLVTKGVFFGTIVASGGVIDTSAVEGIDVDLVVRPFGRKGEFITTRDFDVGAFPFHFGMEPVEAAGLTDADDPLTDADGDSVFNEITEGELSAVTIWVATRPRPRVLKLKKKAKRGFKIFKEIGCTSCHIPTLQTNSRYLTFSSPEEADDPTQNVFMKVNLVKSGFKPNKQGGIAVPLFADLKRHNMGDDLKENLNGASPDFNEQFTTARLWGVADSAPYLHDGRALTITDAIYELGGEAEEIRNNFFDLSPTKRDAVLTFLYSLRAPK